MYWDKWTLREETQAAGAQPAAGVDATLPPLEVWKRLLDCMGSSVLCQLQSPPAPEDKTFATRVVGRPS